MKKLTAFVLSLAIAASLFGCENGEAADVTAEDVYGIIENHLENNEMDGNFVACHIDEDENLVVIEMKDVCEERQEEFIHEVFSRHTGSKFIEYIKEHSMLRFEKAS